MDPGTIAGITIGAVAGALVLGNVGRNLTIRRERSKRMDKVRSDVSRRLLNNEIKNTYAVDKGVSEYYRTNGVFSDPARGRGIKKHSFKKTRKQNKKK